MTPMTIGDVASKAGIRASAIRYYERSGLLPPAARAGGRRKYDDAVLKHLAVVMLAREAGFTIREIKVLFRDFSADGPVSTRRRAMGSRKLLELEAAFRRTKLMCDVVRAMMECRCKNLEECGESILRNKDRRRRANAAR